MRKRRRYQAGSVVVSRDGKYWLGQYRENGIKRTATLGKRKGPDPITKADAAKKLAEIVKPLNAAANTTVDQDITVKDYIETVYFPHKRKGRWRKLTSESRTDSITLHIIGAFGGRPMRSMDNRVELQTGWIVCSQRGTGRNGWHTTRWIIFAGI